MKGDEVHAALRYRPGGLIGVSPDAIALWSVVDYLLRADRVSRARERRALRLAKIEGPSSR